MDKKTRNTLSNLLSEVFGDEPIQIYEEVIKKGVSSQKLKESEAESNLKMLEKFTPFHSITKDIQHSNEENIKDFHTTVLERLRKNGHVELSKNQFEAMISQNSIFKNVAQIITGILTDQLKYDQKLVKASTNFARKAKITELAKSYLILNNDDIKTSSFQVLAKGMQNFMNPPINNYVPKEIIQEAGMIQIGMALNQIATTPINRFTPDKIKQKQKRIQSYAGAGKNSTAFLTSCKQVARKWESKNESRLQELLEKQEHQKQAKRHLNAGLKNKEEKPSGLSRTRKLG